MSGLLDSFHMSELQAPLSWWCETYVSMQPPEVQASMQWWSRMPGTATNVGEGEVTTGTRLIKQENIGFSHFPLGLPDRADC